MKGAFVQVHLHLGWMVPETRGGGAVSGHRLRSDRYKRATATCARAVCRHRGAEPLGGRKVQFKVQLQIREISQQPLQSNPVS